MPFTISHLAAVLPLRAGRTRVDALPTAPLVIGAMVPDLPAVLGAADLRPMTHSGPFALAVDLGLTVVLWCAWVLAVRPAVVDLLPEVASRWRPARVRQPVALWWVAAAVAGSATHLVWDAFTHSSEGATWFGAFAAHQRAFLLLQLVSSVVGLAVLLVWGRRWWVRTPVADPSFRHLRWVPRQVAAGVVVVLVVGAGALWRWQHPTTTVFGPVSPGATIGDAVFGALAGALAAVAVVTAASWVLRWRRSVWSEPTPTAQQERVRP